jgi:FAD/FMN-containing dehydrogenase
MPDLVVYPVSQEQVETLVQLASDMDVVVIPFGGGEFYNTSINNFIEQRYGPGSE